VRPDYTHNAGAWIEPFHALLKHRPVLFRTFPINKHETRAVKFLNESRQTLVPVEYKNRELVILSKPFQDEKGSEKARLKYPERRAKKVGIGVVRVWPCSVLPRLDRALRARFRESAQHRRV